MGHWNAEKQLKLETNLKAESENSVKPKTTKVEGMSLPYIEMAMNDGIIILFSLLFLNITYYY